MFQVSFQGECDIDNITITKIDDISDIQYTQIPLFKCVHTVHITKYATMYDVCCSFKANRLFCVHMVYVCDLLCQATGEAFLGLMHIQIAMPWSHTYKKFVHKITIQTYIQQVLNTLTTNDMKDSII